MKKICFLLLSLLLLLANFKGFSQTSDDLWTPTTELNKKETGKIKNSAEPSEFKLYDLNLELLKAKLNVAPKRAAKGLYSGTIITFPNEDGALQKYEVFEASIMEKGLQNKFPNLKSYIGKSLDSLGLLIRFSLTVQGLNSIVLNGSNGVVYISPYSSKSDTYIVYSNKSLLAEEEFICEVEEWKQKTAIDDGYENKLKNNQNEQVTLKSFRLAVATTGEYSKFHLDQEEVGSDATEIEKKEVVLSQIVATMTNVNAVFERDVMLTLVLVENNDDIIFLDGETDNLTNSDHYKILGEGQVAIDSIIGFSNYDVGHTFVAAHLGGVAYLGSSCSNLKGGGVSTASTPEGYYFETVIAHELGHQFGAEHTYNSCGGYVVSNNSSVEPGSGSTILSYGGLCPGQNVQADRDYYFNFISINQMHEHINRMGNSCFTEIDVTNTYPTIEIAQNYTLPIATPFVLNAIVNDQENDLLSFTWEQLNSESVVAPPTSTLTKGPVFRSIPPSEFSNRNFPNLKTVALGNRSATWEVLPSVSRSMKMGLTVRDNNINGAAVSFGTMDLIFDANFGPFEITSQSESKVIWDVGSTKIITWDVANTNQDPINCSHVNILFSEDGGNSFPIVLASNVPNDGIHEISVPNIATGMGKIKVESVNNVFYSMNKGFISINAADNIVYVPDDEFEQELIDRGYDDVKDNYVLINNIKDIESLLLNNSNIQSLKGIEEFSNLVSLKCVNSQISHIDLSKNTKLKHLILSNNLLQDIDVSKNVNLTTVNLDVNQIQSLHFKTNSLLKEISANNNILTDVDLTGTTSIEKIYLNDNKLTALDLTDCTSVKEFSVRSNEGMNNTLATIDLLQNKKLLKIDMMGNSLESINLTNNELLQELILSSNKLVSIELSNNPLLHNLQLSNNELLNLDIASQLNLSEFSIQSNPIVCVQVNESQYNNIPGHWTKNDLTGYAIDCSLINEADFDNDGVFNINDLCSNSPEGVPVDENGCTATQADPDNDGVLMVNDLCPNSPLGEEVNENGCSISPAVLFGIDMVGGKYSEGAIFKYDMEANEFSIEFDFDIRNTGRVPVGGLIRATNGNLYGMANDGGAYYGGVIFEYNIETQAFKKLYDFRYENSGVLPHGKLMQASNGKLYGLTNGGGKFKFGILFMYDLVEGSFHVVHDFTGNEGGAYPFSELVEGLNGNLYGTTQEGGANNIGVLFEFNIHDNLFTKKVEFDELENGKYPKGNLISGTNGKLYGTTVIGGTYHNGVLFEYDPVENIFTKKYEFEFTNHGFKPNCILTQSLNNKIVGITLDGGEYNNGVIFEYDYMQNSYSKKFDFNDVLNWRYLQGGLTQGSNGKFYGTTKEGIHVDQMKPSSLYEFDLVKSEVKIIVDNGLSRLVGPGLLEIHKKDTNVNDQDGDGVIDSKDQCPNSENGAVVNEDGCENTNSELWGVTSGGGTYGSGVIFKYNLESGSYEKVLDFEEFTNGKYPVGSLLKTSGGKLYGVTQYGGQFKSGVLYEYDLSTGEFEIKMNFGGQNGRVPSIGVVQGVNEKIYGLTENGGTYNKGTLYEYDLKLNQFKKIVDFDGVKLGERPMGKLFHASNNRIYGTSQWGGKYGFGVLFEYDIEADVITKLMDFNGEENGGTPSNGFVEPIEGTLYGLTLKGGVHNNGIVFKYDIENKSFIKELDLDTKFEGGSPRGNFMQSGLGKLYSVLNTGGLFQKGSLLEYDLEGSNLHVKHHYGLFENEFTDITGTLIQASNGHLYGVSNSFKDPFKWSLFEFKIASRTLTRKIEINDAEMGNRLFFSQLTEITEDDYDFDGIANHVDNCPETANEDQADLDNDGVGDACDEDIDGDGILNDVDNCPLTVNPDQEDFDGDGIGDICDEDIDNDGVLGEKDNCTYTTLGSKVNELGCFTLSEDNFNLKILSETCPDKSNGSISIRAAENYEYTATVKGISYEFTSEIVISDMEPGNYDVCIEVKGEGFTQCYSLVVEAGVEISGKATTKANKTSISILEGTAPFDVHINGIEILKTQSRTFDLDVKHGDLVEIKSSKDCEGVFAKTIDLFDKFQLQPNPTTGVFDVIVPLNLKEVGIEIYNSNSKRMSSMTYPVLSGKVQLDISHQATGIYLVKILVKEPVLLKVIKK